MRQLQILALLTITLTTGCALRTGMRSDPNDWARVASLKPETDILVQHVDSRSARKETLAVRGRLIAAGPTEIAVRTGSREVRISRAAVQRVALVLNEDERNSRVNGSLIGAAIGAILGLGVTSAADRGIENGAVESIRVTTTAAGAAAGAWADTLSEGRRSRLIYRRD